MYTIRILRETTTDGIRWTIDNWDDYLKYLKELDVPTRPYGIFISNEVKNDAGGLDFEAQVARLYRLSGSRVSCQFIAA
jgi:hypothetical protein